MKIIYYKGTDSSFSRGSYTAVYSDFTGEFVKWTHDYDPVQSNLLTDEEVYLIIKNNNLKGLLSNEGLLKYNKMKSA